MINPVCLGDGSLIVGGKIGSMGHGLLAEGACGGDERVPVGLRGAVGSGGDLVVVTAVDEGVLDEGGCLGGGKMVSVTGV